MTTAADTPGEPRDAGSNLGLRPRPEPDPEILGVITAVVEQLSEVGGPKIEDPGPQSPAWRFSGRWWSLPVAARRDRPWIRS